MTVLLAGGRVTTAVVPTVTWDPLVQQVVEPDTLLLPDLTSLATLNASGGLLEAPQHGAQTANLAGYAFAAGKFTPSIRPLGTVSPSNFFHWNADGLLSGDQFTVEFWAMHPTLNWQDVDSKTLAEIRTPTLIMPLSFTGAGSGITITWEIFPHATDGNALKVKKVLTITEANLNIAAGTWAHVAIVNRTDATVRVLINGVDVGGVSAFPIPTQITDAGGDQGIRFGGSDGGASGFAISDIRVSRSARTPAVPTVVKSLAGSIAANPAVVAGAVPDDFLGCLHGFPSATPFGEVEPVMRTMRTDKFLFVTPIKAGATDATHPTLGQSGLFAYDWQVVDRSLALLSDRGIKAWISVDGTPQILGGTVAPYSGSQLTSGLAYQSSYSYEVPNDNTAWVNIVKDLVHHIGTLPVDIYAWSVHNEPDGGFWSGTRSAFMDHYERTANAIRAIDATTPIIGGEIVAVYGATSTWVGDLVAKHVASGCPLDGFTYHDYNGDLRYPLDAQILLNEVLVANGLTAGSIPLYLGEFNFSSRLLPSSASDDLKEDFLHIRAYGAAYTAAFVANILATTGAQGMVYSHIAYNDPRDLGFAMTQLIGPDLEHWGPYNAMEGLQMVLGDERLTLDADLPPGVHAYAGHDSVTGRVGVVIASYGWANLASRTVRVHLPGMTGTKRLRRYLVDPTHSSRWDTFEDDPGGSVDQDLELMEDRTASAAILRDLEVTVPRWSAQFLVLDPA